MNPPLICNAPIPSETATPTTVANTERTSIIVPIGPSTLSPKIGRSVREIKPGSFFLNCA